MKNACSIHSNPSESPVKKKKTALRGLFNTLVNVCSNNQLLNMSKASQKMKNHVLAPIGNDLVTKFEKSGHNLTRSVMVLYRGGLISKEKYNSIRSSEMYCSDDKGKKKRIHLSNGLRTTSLVPYKELSKFIKRIDIGVLHHLQTEPDEDVDEQNVSIGSTISGCFIDLEERLIQIASMYLKLNKSTNILQWFCNPGTFLVAISADGAPFGKENEATAWLISFLNVGKRVASCEDNFLVLGANCKEDDPAMIQYGKKIRDEIKLIESKKYTITGCDLEIKFVFELIPADMKWLATFSGELCNSATYNSSFANVTSKKEDLANINGSIGNDNNCTWKPWSYDQRIKDAKYVAIYKETIKDKSEKQARPLITKFIAKKNSRQEFEPILGKLICKAKAEPLHLGNNCWQAWNKEVMTIALARTNVDNSINSVKQLPFDCCFRKYLRAVRNKVKAKRLYKKILKWFREKKKDTDFSSRFTGEETRKFCQNFMLIIDAIISPTDTECVKLRIYSLAYVGLNLRNVTSLMNRIDIDEQGIIDLDKYCKQYFICSSLFLSNITLSMWTVGYCVPYHARLLFHSLGVGLGINTMQGREAKHQKLKHYAEFSLPKERWEKVFLHEHMSLIWLREQNPHLVKYSKSKEKYILEKCYSDSHCFCGFPKEVNETSCQYCQSDLMVAIAASVEAKSLNQHIESVINNNSS